MKNETIERALKLREDISKLQQHKDRVYTYRDGGGVYKIAAALGTGSPEYLKPEFLPITYTELTSLYRAKVDARIAELVAELEAL